MAPTRPLVAQQIHACYSVTGIPMNVTVELTGTTDAESRKAIWANPLNKVFFATPQVIQNDLESGICPANDICLVVIDEAHKATGNHAYVQVIKEISIKSDVFRVLALTATPGSDMKTVQTIVSNCLISRIEIRTEDSDDIKPYIFVKKLDKIVIQLGEPINTIKNDFVKVIKPILQSLNSKNAYYEKEPSLASSYGLIQARDKMRKSGHSASCESEFAVAISLLKAFALLSQHGIRVFFSNLQHFLLESNESNKVNSLQKRICAGNDFKKVFDYIKKLLPDPTFISHPKIDTLVSIVVEHFLNHGAEGENPIENSRIMIFSEYRESVEEIVNALSVHQPLVKPMAFVGQSSGKKSGKGYTQKEQMQVLSKFQSGNHNVLVSTCIGEEGLDIGQVDLIICYDSQNSPIRMLQRSGRTGRKREGRIVLLLSEGKEEDAHEKSMASYKHVQKGIQDGRKLTMFPPNRMLPVGVRPKREFIKVDVVDVPPAKKERKSKASSTTTTAKTSKAAGIVYTANEKSLMNRLSTIYPLDRSIKFESSNLGKYPHYNTCPLNDGVVSRSSTSLMLVEFLNESDNLKSCLTSVKIPRRPDFNHVNHKNGLFYLDQVNIIDSDSDVSIVHASKRPKTNVIEDDDDSLSESDLPNFSVMKKKEVIVIESDDDEQPIEIELMHNLYAFDKLAEDLEFQVEDGHDFQDYEYETPLIEEYIAESIITTASSSRIYSFNELFRQDQDPVDAEIKVYLGTSPNDFLKGIESLCNNGNIIIELKQFPIYSSSFNSIIGAESFNDLVDKDISMDEKVDQLNVKYVSIDEKVEELIDNDISMDELIDNDISKDEKLDELIETDFKQNQIKREQSFDIHSDDEFDWNAVELPVEKLETKLLESKPECVQDQFADCDDDFFDAFQLEVDFCAAISEPKLDQTSKYTQDKITTFTKQTPLSESVFKVPAPHIPASNLQPSKISPYYRSPFVNSDDSQQFIPSKKRMIIQSSPDSTTISPFIKSINRPNEKSPFVNRSSFAVNDDIEEINNPRILKPDVLRDRIAAKKNVVRKEPKVRRTPVMNKEIRKTGNHKLPKKSMRDGNPFFEFEADVVLSDGSGGVIDFVDLESDFENDYELDQDLSGFIASQETPNEEHAMTGVYLQSIVDSKVDEKAIKQHARNLKYLVDNESSDDSMKDFVVDDSNATPEELPRNDVLDLVDDVFESPKKRVAMPKGKSQFVNSRVGNQRPIETDKGKKFEKMVEAPAKTVVSNQFNRSATKPAIKGNNELKPLVFVKPWMKK